MIFGFFNYEKEGKGVKKDEYTPRFTLYFKLLFRKFGLMIKANFIYLIVSILALITVKVGYNALFSQGENGPFYAALFLVAATVYMAVVGMGFIMPGLTYLTRNFARQKHVWVFSDFFEHIGSNFKKSIILFLIDTVMLLLLNNAINVYSNLMATNGIMIVPMAIIIAFVCIYFMMHFYIYPIMDTFDLSFKDILKNSLILTIAHLPWNILITVVIFLISFASYFVSTYMGLLIMAVFGVALINFTVNYMVDPIIDKHLYIPATVIAEQESENDKEEQKTN